MDPITAFAMVQGAISGVRKLCAVVKEAQAAGKISAGKTLALVTSASHMPRAMLLFQQQGVTPVAAPTYYIAKWPADWRFGSEGLLKSERAIYEYLGLAWAQVTR